MRAAGASALPARNVATMRIFYTKILIGILATLILSLSVAAYSIIRLLQSNFHENLRAQLLIDATLAAELVRSRGVGPENASELDRVVKALGTQLNLRLTVILPDGRVVADSLHDPATMENHRLRPEVLEALGTGVGVNTRESATIHIPMTYLAVPLKQESRLVAVVRVALPQSRIHAASTRTVYHSVLYGACAGALVAALIAIVVARYYARPIALLREAAQKISDGDFRYRLSLGTKDELSQVAEFLNEMTERLGNTVKELNREKERISAILSGMNEQVVLISKDSLIYLANAAFCRLFGLEAAALEGRPFQDAIPNPPLVDFIHRALESKEAMQQDFPYLQNGRPLEFRLSSSPIISQKGKFRGGVVIFHDVSSVKEMETLRRKFADNVSHELQTPLSSILAVVETLLDHDPPEVEVRKRFYHSLRNNASRLHQLISDLLDLSEIEQKKASLEPKPEDIEEIVREVVADLTPAAAAKNHAITVEIPPDLPVASVDRQALGQVLRNIVDNAVKYTEPGGQIRVAVAAMGDRLRVDVEDSGIGIPEADIPRIFERFYRVDKARSIKSGGTGLGLAIVKHTLEAMNGKISVVSVAGKGSCFTVCIPLSSTGVPGGDG